MSGDRDPQGWTWPYVVVTLLLLLAFAIWSAGLAR